MIQIARRTLRLIVFLAAAAAAPLARAASPGDVDKAIQKAKAYLYSQQKNGTWEIAPEGEMSPKGKHRGGLTAVVTYALVAAGESPQDPRLVKAIEFLKTADMPSAYALGCRTQLWQLLPQTKQIKVLAQSDANRLVKQIKGGPQSRGLFYYPDTPDSEYDMSISQYGVLGLWACENAGAEIPGRVWEEMDRAWRAHQFKDGGWNYHNNPTSPSESGVSPSMTAAGVATLFITHDAVKAKDYLGCTGNKQDDNIERGLDWMSKHFDDVFTGGVRGPGIVHYTLYGVERIGAAAGYKYFGKVDWFQAGSDFLVKGQGADGAWGSGPGDVFGNNLNNIPTTCFSLLFLARGRSPVIVNKLRHDPPNKAAHANWNQRPRDCANLAAWMGRNLEHSLNWQITNLDVPVDELLDAPVLYLGGSGELAFTAEQEGKLRQFVEDGGLILGNADCNSKAFSTTFMTLGQKLFPACEFREIPDDHPILSNQQYLRATFKNKPAIQGLSNGSRELMLLLTTDPARTWQTTFDGRIEPYALGADVLLYAVDKKGLRNRNVTYVVRPDPKAPVTRTIKLARLSYSGNWDPEPGGWRRLDAILRNKDKLDLKVRPVALGEGKLCEPAPPVQKLDPKELRTRAFKRVPPEKMAETAGDTAKIDALIQAEMKNIEKELADQASAGRGKNSQYDVAHLTGAGKVTFSEAQAKELKEFTAGGGLLLIDCAGGSGEFAESVEAALAGVLDAGAAAALKRPLPPDHPLLKGLADKPDVYRAFARKRLGNTKAPRLRGVTINNKMAVLYSPEDLSTGLVGQEVDGIVGYAPAAATSIIRHIILSAAGG